MSALIENIRRFNRKERYWLLRHAHGDQDFALGVTFRRDLETRLPVPIGSDYYAAMDYHLDWLFAALATSRDSGRRVFTRPKGSAEVTATQEDIDYLVAWETDGGQHVLLLEAKGDSPFSNSQLRSKAARLAAIFGDDGRQFPGVTPHFLITSPRRPQQIDFSDWPTWMPKDVEKLWFRLPMAENLVKVTRSDPDGRADKDGMFWTVTPTTKVTNGRGTSS